MSQKLWYLDRRAEYLATIHLSRRDDLVITKQPSAENYGFDILVSICQNLKPMGRVFGIQLEALKSLKPFYQEQFSVNEIKLNIETSKPKDIPFPIYFFVFTMENDEGYYRKMTSPTLNDNLFKRLSFDAIDKIVEEVNLW
ncbi:MAG: hypothetical protein DRR16_09395, partial [Candidatus Parabeggiatoa sp. nov. 3]